MRWMEKYPEAHCRLAPGTGRFLFSFFFSLLLMLAGILPSISHGQSEFQPYQSPNLDRVIFDPGEVALTDEAKASLVRVLTLLATREDCPPLIRARALGIALRLDPLHREAFAANMHFGLGRTPPVEDQVTTVFTASESLVQFVEMLKSAETNFPDRKFGESIKLAGYVLDLAASADPFNVDRAYALKVLKVERGLAVDWSAVTGKWDGGDTVTASPPSVLAPTEPSSTSMSVAKVGPDLGRLQASIKGLLVRPLDANQFAGKASQMNATAEVRSGQPEINVKFNQSVGSSMGSALHEVVKYTRLRHKGLPGGYQVEIAFEEQYIPKDGPSAAVACALLLESLISDVDLDSKFAVTGDLNADGTVQPVGGITGKLRGAASRDCNVVAIPSANARVISDLLIMEGARALNRIQIFSLETFDDALKLAVTHNDRGDEVKRAIELFAGVQTVLKRSNGMAYLKNSHVQQRLRECLKLMPNHLSARYLLVAATGRTPEHLSLSGSLEYIDRSAEPLLRLLRAGDFNARASLQGDEFANSSIALKRIRTRLDERVVRLSDGIVDYSALMRKFVNNRPTSPNGINDLIDQINQAGGLVSRLYDELESRVDVQEELMR